MANSKRKNKPSASAKKRKPRSRTNSSAAKSKTTAKADTKKKTGNEKAGKEKDAGIPMFSEIELIAAIGIMLLMMLSNFGLCGYMGKALSSFFFGVFGCVQYVMPVAFCLGVFLLIANDYSLLSIKKCTAGFIALMMISAFAQII